MNNPRTFTKNSPDLVTPVVEAMFQSSSRTDFELALVAAGAALKPVTGASFEPASRTVFEPFIPASVQSLIPLSPAYTDPPSHESKPFAVYILTDSLRGQFVIGMRRDMGLFKEMIKKTCSLQPQTGQPVVDRLVYYRHFTDAAKATTYLHSLNFFTGMQKRRLIIKQNPNWENRWDLASKQFTEKKLTDKVACRNRTAWQEGARTTHRRELLARSSQKPFESGRKCLQTSLFEFN